MEIYIKRILSMLIISVLILTIIGCGTNVQKQGNAKEQEGTNEMNQKPDESKGEVGNNGNKGIVAGSIVSSATISPLNSNGVSIIYSLKNQTERVKEFTFNTSQKFDYILSSEDGKFIKRFSEDKNFLQAITFITLKQGETYEIPVRLSNLKEGKYSLSIWLTSNSEDDYKIKIPFEIPLN